MNQPEATPIWQPGQPKLLDRVLGREDFQDAADQGRLAYSRPSRDDKHLMLARLPDRFLLPELRAIAVVPAVHALREVAAAFSELHLACFDPGQRLVIALS